MFEMRFAPEDATSVHGNEDLGLEDESADGACPQRVETSKTSRSQVGVKHEGGKDVTSKGRCGMRGRCGMMVKNADRDEAGHVGSRRG